MNDSSFPRGGGASLNPIELREVYDSVTQDTMKSSNKRPNKDSIKKQKKIKTEAAAEQVFTKKETLSMNKLSVGQILLGAVKAITEIDIAVSLPNQMTGYVSITEISPTLTAQIEKATMDDDYETEIPSLNSFFSIGQLIPVIILEIASIGGTEKIKKRINLSMNPHYINKSIIPQNISIGLSLSAYVVSREDHGYLLNSGISDTMTFLSTESLSSLKSDQLIIGQLVQCTVKTIDPNFKSFKVDLRSSKDILKSDQVPTIQNLIPGTSVQCQITEVSENQLVVSIHQLFTGFIEFLHFDHTTTFKVKQKITAVIIFVDFSRKTIFLSLNQHIVQYIPILLAEPIGSIHELAVVSKDENNGLLVLLPGGSMGFVHINRATDSPIKKLGDKFNIGTTHLGRLVSIDYLDGLYSFSLQKKILETPFLNHQDVKVGMDIEVSVLKITENGVLVNISDNITALIPSLHLADTKLVNPEKKFRSGVKIKSRVLAVDYIKKRIILTCKKSLLSSSHPIVSDYLPELVNTVTHGVIKKIEDFGLLISFYSNVQAICLKPDLGIALVNSDNWKSGFIIGQVIACRISNVDESEKKMRVSLKLQNNIEFENILPGTVYTGKVIAKDVDNQQVILNIQELNIKSILPKAHLSDDFKLNDEKMKQLKKGTTFQVVVISVDKHHQKVFVSIKDSLIQYSLNNDKSVLLINSVVPAYVTKITEGYCIIMTASAQILIVSKKNISDTFISTISSYLSINQSANARIIAINPDSKYEASLRLSDLGIKSTNSTHIIKQSSKTLDTGMVTFGKITAINSDSGLIVQLLPHKSGRVSLTQISDTYTSDPLSAYSVGQTIQCYIIEYGAGKKIELSLRQSLLNPDKSHQIQDPDYEDIKSMEIGQKVRGYIHNTTDNGCFVSVSRKLVARVKICDLSDAFIKDFISAFPKGRLVEGLITSVNIEQFKIDMTLKESKVSPTFRTIEFGSIEIGNIFKGTIKKIERYGVFIQLENSKICGLCHSSEITEEKSVDPNSIYAVGDSVLAKVILVDESKKRVNFTLKASQFGDEETQDILKQEETTTQEKGDEVTQVDAMETDDINDDSLPISIEPLSVQAFKWNSQPEKIMIDDCQDSETSDDSQDLAPKSKKSKREKKTEKNKQKEQISIQENSLVDQNTTPEVADDYERLILGSPNSSFIWIKYIAFYLSLTEIEKARAIGERALQKISFREQQEKMNVWTALLNLENTYGNDESMKKIVDRAIIMNEPKKIYLLLCTMYEQSKKPQKAESTFEILVKKFKDSSKVWTTYASYKLKLNQVDAFREIMKKSLISLPKRKHVKTIVKYAQMEYKIGEAERARTIFEGVLGNYPKRLDLWNVYLDLEIKTNKKQSVRNLFERVISMKLSSKKIKFFLKKYLEFEKVHGDEKGIEHVKEAAQAYVAKMQRSGENEE